MNAEKNDIACPCCGYESLDANGEHEICEVCWWEDDGQDNDNAHIALGGANVVSLLRGRINYLNHGIYDPSRTDLFATRHDPVDYIQRRFFVLDPDGKTLREQGTTWFASLDNEVVHK